MPQEDYTSMATTQLTERQKQVQDLVKDGKSPAEIGTALGITTNGVYQQLRRIRELTGKSKPKATTKKASGAKPAAAKSGRSSARKPAATPAATPKPAATPAPAPTPVAKPLTPLQAVRAQRDEVTASLKQAEQDVKNAQAVLARVEAARDKLAEKVAPQVAQLDAAEAALQGRLALPEPAETQAAPAPAASEPEAPTPQAQAAKPATAKPKGSSTPKKATSGKPAAAPKPAAPKPDAAATPEPTSQAEREATADPFEDGEGAGLADEARAAQESAEAPVPA